MRLKACRLPDGVVAVLISVSYFFIFDYYIAAFFALCVGYAVLAPPSLHSFLSCHTIEHVLAIRRMRASTFGGASKKMEKYPLVLLSSKAFQTEHI